MVPFDSLGQQSGIIAELRVTAEAAARLSGYNIQHIRRLCLMGRLDAIHVGRAWLIRLDSLEAYLTEVVPAGDGRFGPRRGGQLNTQQEKASA